MLETLPIKLALFILYFGKKDIVKKRAISRQVD